MKYCPETTKKITDMIEMDNFTIPEICAKVKISEATFHNWCNTKFEFLEAVKKAKELLQDNIAIECRRSIMKKVKGYDFDEVSTVYGTRKVIIDGVETMQPYQKEKKVIKKHIPASDAILIYTYSNLDPRFKRTDQVEPPAAQQTNNSINITVSNEEEKKTVLAIIEKFK